MNESKLAIEALIKKFEGLSSKEKNAYNEANTSNVFIRPLFEALGWDFSDFNSVEAEKTILKGRVDYLLKYKRITKFCLEIKSLKNDLSDENRRQAIDYAYNKGVTWAILTNFNRTIVFNAEIKTDDFKVAQIFDHNISNYLIDYQQGLHLLSKDSASEDKLDGIAENFSKVARRTPIEIKLFGQLAKWREGLFKNIYHYNKAKGISESVTDLLIERLFNRLIFIRTAEDRGLAGNHPLLSALHQWDNSEKQSEALLNSVKDIFKDFVETFDSDLFPLHDIWQQIEINDDHLLAEIIKGLYEVPGEFAKYNFSVIEPDILGHVYEQYLGYVAKTVQPKPKIQPSLIPQAEEQQFEVISEKGKRKKGGIYYTPYWVTDYIVRQTVEKYLNEHNYNENRDIKILDPACGSGSFLIRAYDTLLQYHAKVRGKLVGELSWAERIEILTRNIFGVDIDQQAVEIACLNLLIRALADRDSLPSLSNTIRCHNSLIFGNEKELLQKYGKDFNNLKPVDWKSISENGFDIIIGNPPYIMELRDNKDIFRQLRVTEFGNKYYEPKMDIFYYFMELGIDLLKPGGYLGFIIQEYWVSRTHASKLRNKVFEETHPLVLVDFKDYKVFQDAPGQHNMITILKKSQEQNADTLTLQIKNSEVKEKQIITALASEVDSQVMFEVRNANKSQLYNAKSDKVYIINDAVSSILSKLAENSFNLNTSEIQQGLVTPQHNLTAQALLKLKSPSMHKSGEGIFILSNTEKKAHAFTEKEKTILKPFHYAEELDRYYYKPGVDKYLIYTTNDVAKDIQANPKDYPNIKAHLDQYQAVITSDNKPYGIHRARQPEWFEDHAKIVVVRKTLYPKFCVIPESWYGDQAILIIRLIEHSQYLPNFITAVLNSKVGHFWLFQQKTQGNQLQVDKEVLLYFPFPNIELENENDKARYEEVLSIVENVVELKRELEESKNSPLGMLDENSKKLKAEIIKYENQIDQLVFSIYRLDKEDVEQIEKVIQEFSWLEQAH